MACKLCGICVLVRGFFICDHVWSCGVSSCGFLIDCKHLTGNSLFYKWVKRTFLIFSQEPGAAELSQESACVANVSADASSFFLNFMWLNNNQVPGEKNRNLYIWDDPSVYPHISDLCMHVYWQVGGHSPQADRLTFKHTVHQPSGVRANKHSPESWHWHVLSTFAAPEVRDAPEREWSDPDWSPLKELWMSAVFSKAKL